MKILFFALLMGLPFCMLSQSKVDFGRVDVNQLSERLNISGKTLTDYVYNDIPKEYKDQLSNRKAMQFADQSARGSINFLTGGRAYNGWDEMDTYVNEVLQSVMPEELNDKQFVKAYVLKDGSPNAFMTPSGLFFINVGMLAEIDSESSLAGIIAHELAHYVLRHGLDRLVRSESGEFDGGVFFNNRKAISAFSIDNELDSDALAAKYLRAAGYEVEGLADAFQVFKRQEAKRLLQLQDVWEIKETTHPNSTARIERIHELIAEQEQDATSDGLKRRTGNVTLFNKLRKEAKIEVLKYLLANYAYQQCLEKAFSFHILEPDNPTFIYYVMESIRRSCYLDVTIWNKKFLVDNYHDIEVKRGVRKKVKIETHLFDKFRPAILSMDSSDYDNIVAKFYWEEETKFTTYEQAFQFFYQIGKFLKEPECALSNALSLSFNPKLMATYLKEYLAYGDVLHKEFAQALLDDEIYEKLATRKLTVFHQFMPVLKHGVDHIAIWHRGSDQKLKEAMGKAVASFPDRDYLYLPDMKTTKVNDYLTLSSMEGFSFQPLFARGEKTELHILNPNYWEIMKRYGTNRIEFVNCVFNDRAKGAFTMEMYQEVINSSFDDILNKTNEKGRYVKMYVSGLQISADGPMKLRAYDGSDKLAVKGEGYILLGEVLKEKLVDLDKSSQ